VTAVPAIASGAMLPMTPLPGTAGPHMPPVTIMPTISASGPDPVSVDPDIVRAGRNRTLVINIRRLIGYIALDFTAGKADTPSYYNEH